MTQEHIIITEEVQKDGELVTIERETLQTTTPTPKEIKGQQAYGVTHPGYVSAQDRTYEYDEAIGMSRSVPLDGPTDPGPTEAELQERADSLVDDEDDETEEFESEATLVQNPDECGHPVGDGSCILESGHSGQHRRYAE